MLYTFLFLNALFLFGTYDRIMDPDQFSPFVAVCWFLVFLFLRTVNVWLFAAVCLIYLYLVFEERAQAHYDDEGWTTDSTFEDNEPFLHPIHGIDRDSIAFLEPVSEKEKINLLPPKPSPLKHQLSPAHGVGCNSSTIREPVQMYKPPPAVEMKSEKDIFKALPPKPSAPKCQFSSTHDIGCNSSDSREPVPIYKDSPLSVKWRTKKLNNIKVPPIEVPPIEVPPPTSIPRKYRFTPVNGAGCDGGAFHEPVPTNNSPPSVESEAEKDNVPQPKLQSAVSEGDAEPFEVPHPKLHSAVFEGDTEPCNPKEEEDTVEEACFEAPQPKLHSVASEGDTELLNPKCKEDPVMGPCSEVLQPKLYSVGDKVTFKYRFFDKTIPAEIDEIIYDGNTVRHYSVCYPPCSVNYANPVQEPGGELVFLEIPPKFSVGDKVIHKARSWQEATPAVVVRIITHEDFYPSYAVRMPDGEEREAVDSHLTPAPKTPISTYTKGQDVLYCRNNTRVMAKVVNVYFDDDLVAYYDIQCVDGSERQTIDSYLEEDPDPDL